MAASRSVLQRFSDAIRLVIFLRRCWQAYRLCETADVAYTSISQYDVPHTVLLVARGRAAWSVSDFAIDFFKAERGWGTRNGQS